MDKNNLRDEEVLLQSGSNPRLFSILVDRYQTIFLRKAMGFSKDKGDAEDMVQDTFIKIYKHADSFDPTIGSFKSWAWKILLNTCKTFAIKKQTGCRRKIIVDFSEVDFKDENIPNGCIDDYNLLYKTLSLLPENFSRILTSYFLENKNCKTIAREEKITNGALRVKIFRAKKYFKKLYQKSII
jgi:RNA polymerase sigma-70 factor (ECF subfamily)